MKVLVVYNPRSGSGSPGLFDYVRELGEAGTEVTIRYFAEGTTLEGLLRDAREYDRVVAAGGDGTVSAIAYCLRGTGVPIVAYPAGTGNLLALNLRMPSGARALAQVTREGNTLATDLGEIREARFGGGGGVDSAATGFVIMAGAGFDADIMESAVDLKPLLGVGGYFVAALQHLTPTVAALELDIDGEKVSTDGIAVVLVNFGRIQFDLAVTHESDAHDGMLEVAVIRARDAGGLIPVVWAALLDRIGDHPDRSSGMEVYRGRCIHVTSHPPLPLQYDGDAIGRTTPFVAEVLPGAATFIVPRER